MSRDNNYVSIQALYDYKYAPNLLDGDVLRVSIQALYDYKLYVTLDTNLTYRWSGSAYTEVSESLAIGITSTTAFRGDWGKIAYDHSQLTNSNPHGTTAAQISNTPAGTISATTVQAAINELDEDRVQLETE